MIQFSIIALINVSIFKTNPYVSAHANVPYMLSGSVAMNIYTLPRSTRDFDFVVNLQLNNIEALLQTFKEYYCEEDAVKEALKHRGMFNIIDHASGFKADFVILKNEPFKQVEFERRKKVDFFDTAVFLVSAEDLLLSKLIWIHQIQSTIQMDDIKNLALVETLDWPYIHTWLDHLKLNTFDLIKHD